MIAFVRGLPVAIEAEAAVIDVGGVGYRVLMPESHAARLEADVETTVHTLTYVREDQFTLFGFLEPASRQVFSKLITINKVGPKLALAIMTTFTLGQLRDAAIQGNIAALKKVPGVGAKTAARLALELEGMTEMLIAAGTSTSPTADVGGTPLPPLAGTVWDDAGSALEHLGYGSHDVDKALAEVRADSPDLDDLQHVVRAALVHLRGR